MSLYFNPNVEIHEAVEFSIGAPPQSVETSAVIPSNWYTIHEVRRAMGIAHANCAPDGAILYIYARQAQDNSGTGAKALGGANLVVASGEECIGAIVEFREDDIDTFNGFDYFAFNFYHTSPTALDCSMLIGIIPYTRDHNLIHDLHGGGIWCAGVTSSTTSPAP